MRGLPRPLIYRLIFLFCGNLVLLLLIRLLLKEGASFSQVLSRAGPDCAPTILAGLGMTGIILTGAIDLSIAGIVAVSASTFGVCVYWNLPPLVCYAVCAVTAWLLASFNGRLVRWLGVPALIVTLAGLTFYRGVALIVTDLGIPDFGGNLSVHADQYHEPGKLYAGSILAVMLAFAMLWEAFGEIPRRWLALGNSREACCLQGLNVDHILQSAFSSGGIFFAAGTLIEVTQIQAIEPARIAVGFELQVIGAVVLGGTNIFGGEGCYLGAVLGAFFLYFTEQVLIYAGVSPYLQDVIIGGAIIVVIAMDCALHKKRKRLEELA